MIEIDLDVMLAIRKMTSLELAEKMANGDENAKNELKQVATKELREIGKTTKIVVVGKGCDTFTI